MPAAWRSYRSNFSLFKKIIHSAFYNYYVWRFYQKRYLRKCYAILVTVPEAGDVLIDMGIKKNIIHVVSNTEDNSTFNSKLVNLDITLKDKYDSLWIALYIGVIWTS